MAQMGAQELRTSSGIIVKKKSTLTPKLQIGAVSGPVGYKPDENVFHISAVPEEKLALKRKTKAESKKDGVGIQKAKWNTSVESTEKLCIRRIRLNADHDRPSMHQYNYRAEVLPPKNPEFNKPPEKLKPSVTKRYSRYGDRDNIPPEMTMAGADERLLVSQVARRTQEMPVNPKLEGKELWNHSSYVEKYDIVNRIQKDEAARLKNSMRKKQALKNYKSPEVLAKEERERLRLIKAGKLVLNQDQNQYQTIPKAFNRYAVEPDRKFKKTIHSGVWEFDKAEDKYVWSDTMSDVKDSPGDITVVVNPDGWNYAAPS
jgi:hypothetical protein